MCSGWSSGCSGWFRGRRRPKTVSVRPGGGTKVRDGSCPSEVLSTQQRNQVSREKEVSSVYLTIAATDLSGCTEVGRFSMLTARNPFRAQRSNHLPICLVSLLSCSFWRSEFLLLYRMLRLVATRARLLANSTVGVTSPA
jgi:hypothetical protein